jgi:urea carboxylase-associated protein 2
MNKWNDGCVRARFIGNCVSMVHRNSSTDTLEAARSHARAQATTAMVAGITIPSTEAVDLPSGVDRATVIWDETVPIGGYASRRLPRDAVLRLTDAAGDASVAFVVFRAEHPIERLNVADTVKVQWQAYLGASALLLSEMGRVLMTLVADTSERHDAICGASTAATNEARYGDGTASGSSPGARELLALAAAKHGLQRRDIPNPLTLFKGVRIGDDGSTTFEGELRPGTFVELRAEVDVLVVLANSPHPLDARESHTGTSVRCTAWRESRPVPDPFRDSTPERRRAFENTEHLLEGGAR